MDPMLRPIVAAAAAKALHEARIAMTPDPQEFEAALLNFARLVGAYAQMRSRGLAPGLALSDAIDRAISDLARLVGIERPFRRQPLPQQLDASLELG